MRSRRVGRVRSKRRVWRVMRRKNVGTRRRNRRVRRETMEAGDRE
jgi:hypothetical protein